jgi:hypothetical protein
MRNFKYPAILFLLVFLAVSCGKIRTLPEEPHIEYTNFKVFDTVDILGNSAKGGRLKFYFEDGNGDVGLPPPDADSADSTDLFLTLYRINDGIRTLAPDDDPLKPTNYRIPYMKRDGQNQILQGTIAVTFFYLFYNEDDTISYDFFIKDRAGNISNTDSTGPIPIFTNGDYY